jgi:hypothetical protein
LLGSSTCHICITSSHHLPISSQTQIPYPHKNGIKNDCLIGIFGLFAVAMSMMRRCPAANCPSKRQRRHKKGRRGEWPRVRPTDGHWSSPAAAFLAHLPVVATSFALLPAMSRGLGGFLPFCLCFFAVPRARPPQIPGIPRAAAPPLRARQNRLCNFGEKLAFPCGDGGTQKFCIICRRS